MIKLVTKGITDEYRSLGAFYVLMALTLSSNEAAIAMPWLYQSAIKILFENICSKNIKNILYLSSFKLYSLKLLRKYVYFVRVLGVKIYWR